MKKFLKMLLVSLGLCASCSKPSLLSPSEFTQEYATALHQASPELKVAITQDLQLKVTTPAGSDVTSFLDNAYASYKQDPANKDSIIQRYVTSGMEMFISHQGNVDKSRIVPVIKDRPWLQETRQALIDRGAKVIPDYVYDDLNSDLVILYAEDSDKSIRYLTPKDLAQANIDKGNLRALATENLRRVLPKIERIGGDGIYIVTAGGDYDASLLVFDSLWNKNQFDVKGDIVVAIPTRDMLIVTGSKEVEGLQKMKDLIEKTPPDAAYRLTKKLFTFHDGKLDVFEPE